MSNTVDVTKRLQGEIDHILGPLIPQSGKFALLDFPNHSNVGDSAIWLGEIEYFKNIHNMKPRFVSNLGRHSSSQLRKVLPKGSIFIHGGGNFGDLWLPHQDFREKILQEFSDRKIIQLPQSVHFESRARLDQAAKIINDHPDFTLLVRDHKSYEIAKENFTCSVLLCPDMAFALEPQTRPCEPDSPLLFLLRIDKERHHDHVGNVKNVSGPYRLEDWLDEEENLNPKILRRTLSELFPRLGLGMFNRYANRELFYRRLAEYRMARGLKLLSSARFVITDRLHTHILCVLLDQPHIALDNSYGKISSFVAAWTTEVANMRTEKTLSAAIEIYNNNAVNIHGPILKEIV